MNSPKRRPPVLMNDAMMQILVRLPLKSLLQCRCVCKWWNSLISDSLFISYYSQQNPQYHVSGFYLEKYLFLRLYSELQYVPWVGQDEAVPVTSLAFIEDDKGICIQHSCNGLLLCSSFRCLEEDRRYYICKPTTKQYLPLPKPCCQKVFGISIAYDPNKLLDYQVICICDSKLSPNHRQIKIYSSATGSWRNSGNPHIIYDDDILFNRGVYWNGALHWVGRGDLSLQFNVEKELMLPMPMPPIPEGRSERRLGYFGESGGHLYLIEIYGPRTTTVFDVLEMRADYSGWSVKYHVDLDIVTDFYYSARDRVVFSILHILHRKVADEVDESVLALQVSGALILYNIGENSFTELPDMSSSGNQNLSLLYSWERVHPYTNFLCYL